MRSVDMAVTRLSGTGSTCISAAPSFMAGLGFALGPEQPETSMLHLGLGMESCHSIVCKLHILGRSLNASDCRAHFTTRISRQKPDRSASALEMTDME